MNFAYHSTSWSRFGLYQSPPKLGDNISYFANKIANPYLIHKSQDDHNYSMLYRIKLDITGLVDHQVHRSQKFKVHELRGQYGNNIQGMIK